MECDETNVRQSPADKIEPEKTDSTANFQKFIYELFDKNGILNDLRAYLRGHIVNVLKSAQTGDPPPCQKKFTQRLELVSQALNILIAEYLLQSDFTYTLSVFISEIPLSNMVFDFAKCLCKNFSTPPNLKFKDCDVWSVLNYLGVKCDSEHASNIVEMYKSEERLPLLFCILKCMPMYRKQSVGIEGEVSSHESLTSSANSLDTVDKRAKVHRHMSCHQNCKHYNFCKSCQNRFSKLREKYKERKKGIVKETKSSDDPLCAENFMKNINVMEKIIINEMFEQLQSVYEAEVELVRQEEESRVRRTLATHALQLQQRREEMEESLKSKQAEIESSAQHKKEFLWGVARALREQHEHVTRAMTVLKDEQDALEQKENHLKSQLVQAEETLRMKGEEMRVQISRELEVLEGHLESMKRERETLNKERSDLENLRSLCDSKTKLIETQGEREKEDLKQHYNVMKDEIAVLRQYIESTKEPKCGIERSTTTEFVELPSNSSVLNNNTRPERCSRSDVPEREVRAPNLLVNDLKKQKNVNFTQSNVHEMYRDVSGARSRSVSSEEDAARASERADAREQDTIQRLMEENESLKHYARQQSEHITALWCERGRSGVARPRTAPALLPAANYFTVHRVNPSSSANTFGWRKGAGEELSLFPAEPPVLPGDPIPFVGILRDRHTDNRRHLINQWRALRRRSSPLSRINKTRPPIPIQRDTAHSAHGNTSPDHGQGTSERATHNICQEAQNDDRQETSTCKEKTREKSPKTMLKEAKENLRNKNSIKEKAPLQKRDKSPNSMLREAKLRLRKLEIEAEAVEKSYFDFRKRQAELREEREGVSILEDRLNTDVVKNLDVTRSRSSQKFRDNNVTEANIPTKETDDVTKDFDKYLRNYQTKINIGETHFRNKTTAREKAKPIPIAYSEMNPKKDKRKNIDYLATPMMEFRKLYHAEKERNVTQLRRNTDTKRCSPKICDQSLIIDTNKEITNDNAEKELTPDSVESSDVTPNKNYDEKNLNNNTGNDIRDTKNMRDLEVKVESVEKCNSENIQQQYKNLEKLRKIKMNKAAELEILKENLNKIYNLSSPRYNISPAEVAIVPTHSVEKDVNNMEYEDKNILRVEVESSYKVSKVKVSESQEGELVFVVQSSVTTKGSEVSDEEAIESIPLTVDITPKDQTGPKSWEIERIESPKSRRSESPEKAAQLTRNDVLNAIFHADDKDISSVDMHVELSIDNVKDLSDNDKDPYGDYPDDFSADVDNYNTNSEYGNNSPISLPKSENDNFWDN